MAPAAPYDFVLLPHEDHGYSARESIGHVLYEQIAWFDKYVKNAEEAELKHEPDSPQRHGEKTRQLNTEKSSKQCLLVFPLRVLRGHLR